MREQLLEKETAMFEQEYRSREQISREAAERYAIMVAITARKAPAVAIHGPRIAVEGNF